VGRINELGLRAASPDFTRLNALSKVFAAGLARIARYIHFGPEMMDNGLRRHAQCRTGLASGLGYCRSRHEAQKTKNPA
jgi:hypothetical protein